MIKDSGPTRIPFRALITMCGETIENGELIIERGVIQSISTEGGRSGPGDLPDFSDCLILPGFVNAHSHLALSALEGMIPKREKFTDWAKELVPVDGNLNPMKRREVMLQKFPVLFRSGVTILADYLADPELIEEFEKLPIRTLVFLEVLGFKNEFAEPLAHEAEKILAKYQSPHPLMKIGLAPHAPYTVSPELFHKLRDLADRYSCPFSCHVAEFPEEVRFLKDGKGEMHDLHLQLGSFEETWTPPRETPLRYLEKLGVLDSMIAVHLNHIDGDIDLLLSRDVGAVFCPGTTRWFGRKQKMPVKQLIQRGAAVGIGTDSLASNETLNFLHELRTAEELLPELTRMEILGMATQGGARVLGFNGGCLAPGKPADFIGFKIKKIPDSWADVPFETGREKVDISMVAGVPLNLEG